jgi:hypothetical protein
MVLISHLQNEYKLGHTVVSRKKIYSSNIIQVDALSEYTVINMHLFRQIIDNNVCMYVCTDVRIFVCWVACMHVYVCMNVCWNDKTNNDVLT